LSDVWEVRVLDDLLEAWLTNNRISLFLIDRVSEAGMNCTLSKIELVFDTSGFR
jgi:hypothetical protein